MGLSSIRFIRRIVKSPFNIRRIRSFCTFLSTFTGPKIIEIVQELREQRDFEVRAPKNWL
jgi:hypothetical protein